MSCYFHQILKNNKIEYINFNTDMTKYCITMNKIIVLKF